MSASAGDGVCVDVAVLGVRLPLVSCFAAPALEHEQVMPFKLVSTQGEKDNILNN